MSTNYINPFTGQTISPASVSYESITISADTTLEWPINGNTPTADIASSIIDVVATATGLHVFLPPATQVSTGQTILVRNIGSNPFTVGTNDGSTIVTIASGIAEFIWLIDNTTVGGSWASIVFGAGTSSANAAALAGAGLTPINLTLNQAYQITNVYSNLNTDATYRAQFLIWQSGAGNITLPSSIALGNNWFVMIRNNGTGILNILPTGTDTIDGLSSKQLQLTESAVFVSNGANGFNTFGYGQAVNYVFTQLLKTITGGTITLTPAEGSSIIQNYVGTLTSNATIILPPTVQLYVISNNTSGAFTVTFKTAAVGGSTVVISSGQTNTIINDGTNVYAAVTAVTGSLTTITLAPGTFTNPSLNFVGNTNTGIYLPSSSEIGISIGASNVATFSTSGLRVPTGISGGSF